MSSYPAQLAQLLPPGALWSLEPGSTLDGALTAIGDELERVRVRGINLIDESDPRTATETIAEWESAVGLPDAQVPVISGVLAERRSAVAAKLAARGGQNFAFFQHLAAVCGWTLITIEKLAGRMLRTGFLVDDLVYGDEFAFTMLVTLNTPPAAGALTDVQMEAVIRHATHSHIRVMFFYL